MSNKVITYDLDKGDLISKLIIDNVQNGNLSEIDKELIFAAFDILEDEEQFPYPLYQKATIAVNADNEVLKKLGLTIEETRLTIDELIKELNSLYDTAKRVQIPKGKVYELRMYTNKVQIRLFFFTEVYNDNNYYVFTDGFILLHDSSADKNLLTNTLGVRTYKIKEFMGRTESSKKRLFK